ncbi:MAG: response regulator transcription factor [Methylococcales bacterium]|nr:response regulator transcription factor [Methylococcales bacterium]
MISVLLVDDHAVVREGYKAFLSLCQRIGPIYEADCGELACALYDRHAPDVVVMDLSMPGIGGLEAIRRLKARASGCRILVFSIYQEKVYALQALKAGAKGYIAKNTSPQVLVDAVCKIADGGHFIDHNLAQALALSSAHDAGQSIMETLTPREFEVFRLLALGLSTRDAADKLHLNHKTVCNHSTLIKEKLSVKTLAELTLLAFREGILPELK